MNGITLFVASIFASLAMIMLGVFVVSWQEGNYRNMFSTAYWIGSFATVFHIFVAFSP